MSKPNLLLVIVDDLPARMAAEMPRTAAALGQGVELTQAVVTTPQCGPSRATILTGKYVHGLRDGGLTNDHTCKRFKEQGWTRGEVAYNLKDAGYTTGLFGKYLNGYEKDMPGYVPPGWDAWKSSFRVRNQIRANVDGALKKPNVGQARESGWLTTSAKSFMDEAAGRGVPSFTVLSFNSPHAPYVPTQESRDYYAAVPLWRGSPPPNFDYLDPNKPAWVRQTAGPPLTQTERTEITSEWRGKAAETRDIDNALGPVLEAVNYETTYVFFLSDNGYQLGSHRLRQKNMPYDESARTPMWVRGPGLMDNAQVSALTANVDIAPTVYEIAGLYDRADACDGRSLLAPMIGAEGYEWRDFLLLERYPDVGIPGWTALRGESEVQIEWGTGDREVYDMAQDPYQKSNVAGSDPIKEHALASRMAEMRTASATALRALETA